MYFKLVFVILKTLKTWFNKLTIFVLVGHESAILEPLQFDLAVIEAATNNFSNENCIGKGGFGEVYKVNTF